MKPFNLEEAKSGKPVITRNGWPARIICWDRKKKDYPIIALVGIEEDITSYTTDGRCYPYEERSFDLFMAGEKREGWINIYKYNIDTDRRGGGIYPTKEKAKEAGLIDENYIATIHLTWEE